MHQGHLIETVFSVIKRLFGKEAKAKNYGRLVKKSKQTDSVQHSQVYSKS
jgi:hypothetical protein